MNSVRHGAAEFLLLRVHRNHRLVLGQGRLNRVVDEVELGIAAGIVGAFPCLAIGLQAELLLFQQLANDSVADLVAEPLQFGG